MHSSAFFLRILLWFLCAVATVSAAEPGKAGNTIPAGDLRDDSGFYSIVFYYSPDPSADPEATARALVAKAFPGVPFLTEEKPEIRPPFIAIEDERAPLKIFPVPPTSYFKYAGRGLGAEAIAGIQKTSRATRLLLIAPREDVWKAGRKFTQLAHDFATATGATLWDSATRECFSREAWKEKRLTTWPEDQEIPDIKNHVTMHLYQPDDRSRYLRVITLGMEKFALPDLVVEKLVSSDGKGAGNLINLVAQLLAEKPQVTDATKVLFRVADLRSPTQRKYFEEDWLEKATGEIRLTLLKGKPDEGDPENRLIELDFRNAPGKTNEERRNAALSTLWGSKDEVVGVKHDAELLDASEQARAKLPALRKQFTAGLPPGERLLLKVPFARDDEGQEWMWVEVMQWPTSGKISGILQNDPFYIKSLRAGSKVRIEEGEVFDFIHYRADGTIEGNETGKIMQKRSEAETKK
jgi:uncharacterized protein YegJ (DUF2314 family)